MKEIQPLRWNCVRTTFRLPMNVPPWWEGHLIHYKVYEPGTANVGGGESGGGLCCVQLCERNGGSGDEYDDPEDPENDWPGKGEPTWAPDPRLWPPVQPWEVIKLLKPETREDGLPPRKNAGPEKIRCRVLSVDVERPEPFDPDDEEHVGRCFWVIEADLFWDEHVA